MHLSSRVVRSLPPQRGGALRRALPGRSRILTQLRVLASPMNVLLGGLLVLGWLAFVGWTGAGPTGWQARVCGGLDLRPQACGPVRTRDEAVRRLGSRLS
ncbi:hypothetical protein U8607_14895 [Methylobacterium durans]|uniref:hypothetical protein n=1 Tax=Methylobacterium durans TaxID=2202825 RepID=UPI002AFE1AD3|nr:hypothetical protein [Methylobacterium durans]MEA1833370.1 hypothetical protein [Methylobacterium durans]